MTSAIHLQCIQAGERADEIMRELIPEYDRELTSGEIMPFKFAGSPAEGRKAASDRLEAIDSGWRDYFRVLVPNG